MVEFRRGITKKELIESLTDREIKKLIYSYLNHYASENRIVKLISKGIPKKDIIFILEKT